jgi:RND family efflux transporter MFP subunit
MRGVPWLSRCVSGARRPALILLLAGAVGAVAPVRAATPATVSGPAIVRLPGGDRPDAAARALPGPGAARGIVRAVREATLSSRLAARVLEMPLAEGQSFARGDVLLRFDCERQRAEARAAAATVEVQTKTVETHQELDRFNAIGRNELLISIAQLDKVTAESEALKTSLKDCELRAPYAGRVSQHLVRSFEAVSVSQPLIRIVDGSELELQLIVPSAWLGWLEAGRGFDFAVDETGQRLRARVVRITPDVDPVSKTVRVLGRLQGPARRLQPGMSGTAQFVWPPR